MKTRAAPACRIREGRGPALLFLPGYASDMAGTKACALDQWAAREGRAMIRFDYGGCGESKGAFEEQTLDSWFGDALRMIDAAEGPLILVGSSMGGWLMLLAAIVRPDRISALVGIAAAPDFTDWGYSKAEKTIIRTQGRLEQPSPYGDAPTLTTRAFWESGESAKLLGDEIAIDCPVRLLHGLADAEVPWRNALELVEQLRSDDVQLTLVKDGDHRLSRDGDIALLIAVIESLAA